LIGSPGWVRIEIEAHDIDELGGELRVARSLEAPHSMRLKLVGLPDALHRAQRDAGLSGHRSTGPMRRLVRRGATSQCYHPRHGFGWDRGLAGLAGLVTQQPFHAGLGKALLPAPDHRSADPDRLGDLLCGRAPGRRQNDPRPLHVLPLPPPIPNKRRQPPSIRSAHNHAYCLSHAARIAWLGALVNHQNASVH
jgi:hypothetical protein